MGEKWKGCWIRACTFSHRLVPLMAKGQDRLSTVPFVSLPLDVHVVTQFPKSVYRCYLNIFPVSLFIAHMALSPQKVRGVVNSSLRIRWILLLAWIFALFGLLFAILPFVLNEARSDGLSILMVHLLFCSVFHRY